MYMCANTEQCCVCDCVVRMWYIHISAVQCIDSIDNIDTKVDIAILMEIALVYICAIIVALLLLPGGIVNMTSDWSKKVNFVPVTRATSEVW